MSQPRFKQFFYKKFLVDGESIRQQKNRGKEKNKSEVKQTNGVFFSVNLTVAYNLFKNTLIRSLYLYVW